MRITGLKIPTRIGVYAWEQKINQTLIFDLTIPVDIHAYQDNIANALDYAQVSQCITQFVTSRSFQLLETAAEEVCHLLRQQFSITRLTLTVTKAFAVKNANGIQITLERNWSAYGSENDGTRA